MASDAALIALVVKCGDGFSLFKSVIDCCVDDNENDDKYDDDDDIDDDDDDNDDDDDDNDDNDGDDSDENEVGNGTTVRCVGDSGGI
jgi:hypothetical protein